MKPNDDVTIATTEIFKYLWRQIRAGNDPLGVMYQPMLYRYFPGESEDHVNKRQATQNAIKTALNQIEDHGDDLESEAQFTIFHEVCQCDGDHMPCQEACIVDAIVVDETGRVSIDSGKCIDCGLCYRICESGAIRDTSHILKLANLFPNRNEHAVYGVLAPSFAGQFEGIGYEGVRSRLLSIGFDDIWEVGLGADLITLREVEEFMEYWNSGDKFMISSCCCPVFIKLVERHHPNISHLISDSVSPMLAMGRILKSQDPACKVVFIGPCIAKRGEIQRPELSGAVDVVLTFKEVKEVISEVEPQWDSTHNRHISMQDASHDGRIFAFSGGVTQAIISGVHAQIPHEKIETLRGNGIKECSQLLQKIAAGTRDAHFIEGMACPGGCVAGPGTIIPKEEGKAKVKALANQSPILHSKCNQVASKFLDVIGDQEDLLSRGRVSFNSGHFSRRESSRLE